MLTEHALCSRFFFKNKNISRKLKLILKNTVIDKTLTYASETSTLTKRDRLQLNIFERKVYRRILGPVYGNEKENWRILTDKEIYAIVKKTHIYYIGLDLYREWKEIESQKSIVYEFGINKTKR
jgi:hypothetical protein